MKTVGLITEYNPFHNGHLHHLQESLRSTDSDIAVAVMSGHFLQRGEPALIDKWSRAEMALAAGVDVVVELPLPWACSSAPDFARGAVQALNALGGIDTLCFGSEVGDLQVLQQCAEVLLRKEYELSRETSRLLRSGINYPQARQQVMAEWLPDSFDRAALAAPNNILGIEYLKALRQTESSIVPSTIQRIGAGFHDTIVGERNIASATGIRKLLAAGEPVTALIPPAAQKPLLAVLQSGMSFSSDRYLLLLLGQILRAPSELSTTWLVESGIENRLLTVSGQAESLEALIDGIKSRQLTRTRIQRMLVAILLGLKQEEVVALLSTAPHYLHVLAISTSGQEFLASRRKQGQLPLIQNFSRVYSTLKRYYDQDSPAYRRAFQQLDLELRATRIYTLLMRQFQQQERSRDFYMPVLRNEEPLGGK
ncbi:Predicted nucleotidyltransferase [Malonomonas rubra DSM 5091]|uniref:tRNA(Met) cytidine acetate ligase n=1 Tax=Malonomonas rubra DSM 5091 TaxID=1122189 RepID=A0A1M6EBH7_MALRU|nr:nucleotidyltransferase [Malonomonas rubra]SHI82783.1 Predicted nucleotidyltransferase [Malonomonas rubra DSM 5091]